MFIFTTLKEPCFPVSREKFILLNNPRFVMNTLGLLTDKGRALLLH